MVLPLFLIATHPKGMDRSIRGGGINVFMSPKCLHFEIKDKKARYKYKEMFCSNSLIFLYLAVVYFFRLFTKKLPFQFRTVGVGGSIPLISTNL
jgi:hypothetical protein